MATNMSQRFLSSLILWHDLDFHCYSVNIMNNLLTGMNSYLNTKATVNIKYNSLAGMICILNSKVKDNIMNNSLND